MSTPEKSFDRELLLIKIAHLLDDSNTGLSTFISRIDDIRNMLEKHGEIGVISVDLEAFAEFECIYGWERFDAILRRLGEILDEFAISHLGANNILLIRDKDAPEFLLFFVPENKSEEERFYIYDHIESSARELSDFLSSKSWGLSNTLESNLRFHIGFSRITYNPVLRTERSIYYGLAEAKRRVGEEARAETYRRREILRAIIRKQEINTRYQPIVGLAEPRTVGYEALSFGPVGTDFTNPEMLFAWARETELGMPLDRVCRHRALANCCSWLGPQNIFINTNPFSLEDADFFSRDMQENMARFNISTSQVVIEITERHAIHNFTAFNETLEKLRQDGFRFAVDDAGAGYASLNTIAQVRPEFLKFDMNMTRHIDKDMIKQELLTAVLGFAEKINAQVVAEGIETEGEYNCLKSFGVHLGQGYYLARPIPATADNPPKFVFNERMQE